MKMTYALPLAVAAAMVITGCSHKSDNGAAATANEPAMQAAPASTMSAHPDAMPAAPMSANAGAGSSDPTSSEPSSGSSAN